MRVDGVVSNVVGASSSGALGDNVVSKLAASISHLSSSALAETPAAQIADGLKAMHAAQSPAMQSFPAVEAEPVVSPTVGGQGPSSPQRGK